MLLRLFVFRLIPMLLLKICKERNRIRSAGVILLISHLLCFTAAVWELVQLQGWRGWLYIPFSMFPHALCYGAAVWMVCRCLWYAWSVRVWKRIYAVSMLLVIAGILMENYWNPVILAFAVKIFS